MPVLKSDPSIVLPKATRKAVLGPNMTIAVRVMMLASPSLAPVTGIGGSIPSIICNIEAIVINIAVSTNSRILSFLLALFVNCINPYLKSRSPSPASPLIFTITRFGRQAMGLPVLFVQPVLTQILSGQAESTTQTRSSAKCTRVMP